MLDQIYRQNSSSTFLRVQQKNFTYGWLQEKIKKISGLFIELSLKPGDRILIAIDDESEFAALFISAMVNGLTTIMLDPATRRNRARSIIERVEPVLIIAAQLSLVDWQLTGGSEIVTLSLQKDSTVSAGLLGKFLQKNKTPVRDNDYLAQLQKANPAIAIPAEPDPALTAYIIFTSGTTAASKGVAISFGNLFAHLSTLKKVYDLKESSVILNQLLLWHADGCIQGPVLAAFTGCAWHYPFTFSIDKIPALLDYGFANDLSHWFVVPAMLNMLVSFAEGYEDSFRYPSFKCMISVSAHLEAPLWDKAEALFGIQVNNVYGLTETVAGSLFCGPQAGTYRKYTAGKPVDTEIKVVDEQGQEVGANETGELLLKGAHVMTAYYNDPRTTEASFRDGWLLTGDFASSDDDGYITIRGRKKNLIISGGYNIQPEEVTECLLKNEAVLEACAIGLHDEVFGEKLVAAVVVKPDFTTGSAELVEHCREWLEEKKIPQKIYIVDSLPKGASGKVQLNELKAQLTKSIVTAVGLTGDIVDEVLAVAAESFQVPVGVLSAADTSQSIAGWDSLAHLTFVTLLEERFNVHFSTAEVMTLNSLKKAIQLLKERNV